MYKLTLSFELGKSLDRCPKSSCKTKRDALVVFTFNSNLLEDYNCSREMGFFNGTIKGEVRDKPGR